MANVMAARWQKLYRSTGPELALEDAVASLGIPYRTQFPGYLYGVRAFPDFYLPTIGLVIEVDGKEHNTDEHRLSDAERTEILQREWGVTVVRCTNREALEDPHGTLISMLRRVGAWPVVSRGPIANALPGSRRPPSKARGRSRRAR